MGPKLLSPKPGALHHRAAPDATAGAFCLELLAGVLPEAGKKDFPKPNAVDDRNP